MGLCQKRFGKPERICALDADHEGDCAGQIDRAVRRIAKAARAQLQGQEERRHREAVALAGPDLAGPAPPSAGNLSPAEFAAAILEIAGEGGASVRQILGRLRARLGQGFTANGVLVRAQQIRQAAARLERDRMASYDGDYIRSIRSATTS